MKRPKKHLHLGHLFLRPLRFADDGTGDGDPAGGGGTGGDTGDTDKDKPAAKTFTQADLNKIGAKQKAEGKAAAEKAVVELLGCTPAEAAEIVKKHREAEDATKSEAEKERAAATREREAAEAEKREAAAEKHEARIERALAASGLATDDSDEGKKKLARVRKMVTVETGATYEDVLADVADVKKDFPELFGAKTDDGDKDKANRKLPGSDPKGKPAKPTGGEDKFTAGQKRFQAEAQKSRGYSPLDKPTT